MKKMALWILGSALLFPSFTSASLGIPFGGHVVAVIPCTCNTLLGLPAMIITYDRFRTVGPIPGFGVSLFYQALPPPAHLLFAKYAVGLPGTWELGAYIPTPGATPSCLQGIPPACIPVPFIPTVIGSITTVGTSLFSF